MAKDPVCDMDVREQEAEAKRLTSEYQGRKYFFCNAACKQDFERDPARYAGAAGGRKAG